MLIPILANASLTRSHVNNDVSRILRFHWTVSHETQFTGSRLTGMEMRKSSHWPGVGVEAKRQSPLTAVPWKPKKHRTAIWLFSLWNPENSTWAGRLLANIPSYCEQTLLLCKQGNHFQDSTFPSPVAYLDLTLDNYDLRSNPG